VDRLEDGPQLVGDVFVEDASPLVEVLGYGDETIDISPGVDAGVLVGLTAASYISSL